MRNFLRNITKYQTNIKAGISTIHFVWFAIQKYDKMTM